MTPLFSAVLFNEPTVVEKIIKLGGDPSLRDIGGPGWTPLEYAKFLGWNEIVDYIEKYNYFNDCNFKNFKYYLDINIKYNLNDLKRKTDNYEDDQKDFKKKRLFKE